MPNWCNNSISITGPEDKIRAIWTEANREDSGLLNAIAPMPDEVFRGNLGEAERQDCADKGIDNWYDWSVSNWGTKWDVSTEGLELSEDGTSITGWFDSAWSPPITALEFLVERHEDIEVTNYFEEPGMDFAGVFRGDGGVHSVDEMSGIQEIVENIVLKDAQVDDELFNELNEYFDFVESRQDWILEDAEEQGNA